MSSPEAWSDLKRRIGEARAKRERVAPPRRGDHDHLALAEIERALALYAEHKGCSRNRLLADEIQDPSVFSFARWLWLDSGLIVAGATSGLEDLLRDLSRLLAGAPRDFPVQDDGLGVSRVPWWVAVEAHRRLARLEPGRLPPLERIALAGGFNAQDLTRVLPGWRHPGELLDRLIELERENPKTEEKEP